MSLLRLKYNDTDYEIDFDNVKNQIIIVDKSTFSHYISPELTKKFFELNYYIEERIYQVSEGEKPFVETCNKVEYDDFIEKIKGYCYKWHHKSDLSLKWGDNNNEIVLYFDVQNNCGSHYNQYYKFSVSCKYEKTEIPLANIINSTNKLKNQVVLLSAFLEENPDSDKINLDELIKLFDNVEVMFHVLEKNIR
jgi:hypothetical protein